MKLKRINIIFFVALMLSSCAKEWLDIKSDKSLTVPLKVADFQALLDNSSVLNVVSTVFQGEIAADGHYYTDNDWNAYMGTTYQNAYTWTNEVDGYVNDWNAPYNAILTLNVVLDGARKIKDEPGADDVIAQALFQRSRLYFDLVQTFSPVYRQATADAVLSVPLRLTTDITQPSVHSSLSEVYAQIIGDLKQAAFQLPIDPLYVTRASQPACFALISRVYLSMQKYDSALHYASKCMDLKNQLIDYNTIPTSSQFIGVNKEVLFFNYYVPMPILVTDYLIDSSFFSLYEKDDLRKQTFFQVNGSRIQFKGTYGNSATDVFAGLALDEVYLTRSECLARLGQVDLSMNTLNILLETRWKKVNGTSTFTAKVASNQKQALEIILQERRKQLILRNVRWMDLRRLNLEPETAVTIIRKVKGVSYTLDPQSYRYVFPIPNEIIQVTNLQQNMGWEH
ncbi:RagB/SusD family nutrient uptake outer membrane protein [Chitinophaga alhagiae]|uniref:RagB/SusD family nutrient uptake outer membrane protein n=1 Tax=Chitinophaga alhagiae TaxID=2203219 RepID=UPI000E5C2CEB|nr:RagB/SusD family nutrient uptake outer membrane protein [Chitinophaga alhagiae]